MATSALILIHTRDDFYKCTTVHYDGYPRGLGAYLLRYLYSLDIVKSLIRLSFYYGISDCLNEDYENLKQTQEYKEIEIKNFFELIENDKYRHAYFYLFKEEKWYILNQVGKLNDLKNHIGINFGTTRTNEIAF